VKHAEQAEEAKEEVTEARLVARVRITLPHHLRNLAGVAGELSLEVARTAEGGVSLVAVLDALEARFPVLRGTIRDQASGKRRPFVRFFACRQDLSHQPMTAALPNDVVEGREALIVLGAMAGG
jgi:sulfur-carrier protein